MPSPITFLIIRTAADIPGSNTINISNDPVESPPDPPKSEISDPEPKINDVNVKGESGTGYEDGNDLGEFECGNCEYFDRYSSSCGQEDMMKMSKRPRVAGSNRVIVDREGCCDYVSRKQKTDTTEDKD